MSSICMPTKRGQLNPDELVERMRKDIEIELVKDVYGHHIPHSTSFILLTILTSPSR